MTSIMKPQRGQELQSVTGLRGLCAWAVVFTHGYQSQKFGIPWSVVVGGNMSVVFFFVLSGFLLFPKVIEEIDAFSPTPKEFKLPNFLKFCIRRIFRVYPAYLASVIIYSLWVVLVPSDPHSLKVQWENVYLAPTDFHYWTVRTELKFYMVFLPLFWIIAGMIIRKWPRIFSIPTIIPGLIGITLIAVYFHSGVGVLDSLWRYREDFRIPFTQFWYGSIAGLIFQQIKKKSSGIDAYLNAKAPWPWHYRNYVANIIILALLTLIAFSNDFVGDIYLGSRAYFYGVSLLEMGVISAVLLIFLGLTDNQTWIGKALSNPLLTASGEISYSIYLIHFIPRNIVLNHPRLEGFDACLAYLVLVFIIASTLYHISENPFRKAADRICKALDRYYKSEKRLLNLSNQPRAIKESEEETETKIIIDENLTSNK